jgi:hypothetical protein
MQTTRETNIMKKTFIHIFANTLWEEEVFFTDLQELESEWSDVVESSNQDPLTFIERDGDIVIRSHRATGKYPYHEETVGRRVNITKYTLGPLAEFPETEERPWNDKLIQFCGQKVTDHELWIGELTRGWNGHSECGIVVGGLSIHGHPFYVID